MVRSRGGRKSMRYHKYNSTLMPNQIHHTYELSIVKKCKMEIFPCLLLTNTNSRWFLAHVELEFGEKNQRSLRWRWTRWIKESRKKMYFRYLNICFSPRSFLPCCFKAWWCYFLDWSYQQSFCSQQYYLKKTSSFWLFFHPKVIISSSEKIIIRA